MQARSQVSGDSLEPVQVHTPALSKGYLAVKDNPRLIATETLKPVYSPQYAKLLPSDLKMLWQDNTHCGSTGDPTPRPHALPE